MNLATNYMGLNLRGPLLAGASPQSDDLQTVAALESAGAAAVVMHSLFEEQISGNVRTDLFGTASTYFPDANAFTLKPEAYIEHLIKLKNTVKIPVIASLNGVTSAGWVRYAQTLQDSGADALELNVYGISADPSESSAEVERCTLNVVASVRSVIHIPLAVKVVPFYSSLPNFARRMADEGADGLVLFNRSYFPYIDMEELTITPMPDLSGPWELPLRLRWLGILYGRVNVSLAVTGGVHTVEDSLRSILAGADVVQMVSALLQRGPEYLQEVMKGIQEWMIQRKFDRLDDFRGLLSLKNCPDAARFDRGAYAHSLQSWNKPKFPI